MYSCHGSNFFLEIMFSQYLVWIYLIFCTLYSDSIIFLIIFIMFEQYTIFALFRMLYESIDTKLLWHVVPPQDE